MLITHNIIVIDLGMIRWDTAFLLLSNFNSSSSFLQWTHCVLSLTWRKVNKRGKRPIPAFPSLAPTMGWTDALKFGWGGHQSGTHQVHIPLKCPFYNKNTQLGHEGKRLICSMNSFLPGRHSGVTHITWVLKNILLWIMQFSHSRFKLDSGF